MISLSAIIRTKVVAREGVSVIFYINFENLSMSTEIIANLLYTTFVR
jgi:hypothetical protein